MDLLGGKNKSGLRRWQGLVAAEQVGAGFAALDQVRLTVRKPEHGRAESAIVITGHAELVGPADRDGDQIAGFDLWQGQVHYKNIPTFTIRPGQTDRLCIRMSWSTDGKGRVMGAIQGGPGIIRKAAIQQRPGATLCPFKRANAVDRHTGARNQAAAGFQPHSRQGQAAQLATIHHRPGDKTDILFHVRLGQFVFMIGHAPASARAEGPFVFQPHFNRQVEQTVDGRTERGGITQLRAQVKMQSTRLETMLPA